MFGLFSLYIDSTLSDVDGMKAVHWSIKSGNIRALQVHTCEWDGLLVSIMFPHNVQAAKHILPKNI